MKINPGVDPETQLLMEGTSVSPKGTSVGGVGGGLEKKILKK
jgi:hypothetical protein